MTFLFTIITLGELCLSNVVDLILNTLGQEKREELTNQLTDVGVDGSIEDKLKSIPWSRIKRELEILGEFELIKTIKEKTLITKGTHTYFPNSFF